MSPKLKPPKADHAFVTFLRLSRTTSPHFPLTTIAARILRIKSSENITSNMGDEEDLKAKIAALQGMLTRNDNTSGFA